MNNFFILIITIILFFFTDFLLSKTSLPINNKSYLMGYKFFIRKLQETFEKKKNYFAWRFISWYGSLS